MKLLVGFFALIATACAIEKPEYEVLKKDGSFEVRKYSNLSLISAPMERMDERNGSFRQLFQYIRGNNEGKKKISMTAPVFLHEEEQKMSFLLPREIETSGAPQPSDKKLALGTIEEGIYAVLRFSGWDEKTKQEKAQISLQQKIKEQGLTPEGESFFAFYNPPWIPEFFRRNEVWQKVKKQQP